MRDLRFASLQLLGVGAVIVLIGGCCQEQGEIGTPPPDERVALARINDNFARITKPVYARAAIRMRYIDNEGKERDSDERDAKLLFLAPRSLRLDVSTINGRIAQFGSNDIRYWAFIDIDEKSRRLWWGYWDQLARRSDRRSMLPPPDQLICALMLQPLPSTPGFLRIERGDFRLFYPRMSGESAATVRVTEIRLDGKPPYLPTEIVERLANGQVLMRASLGDYQPLYPGGPFTARRYDVEWPGRRSRIEMRLSDSALFDGAVPEGYFLEPQQWNGAIEFLDEDSPAAVSFVREGPL